MTNPIDPVQRNIHAIMVRDTIVTDDATDMTLANATPKQIKRQLRAMLAGVDFVGEPTQAILDDPPGRRVGRVAFNALVGALWIDGAWTGPGPAPHRLPESADEICKFILRQTNLGQAVGERASDLELRSIFGFEIEDHARNSDLLRTNGAGCRLFVAASMLSAACAKYEKALARTKSTGRNQNAIDVMALSIEAALIAIARIATEIFLEEENALGRVGRIAKYLVSMTEAYRRTRSFGKTTAAVRMAATAAGGVHLFLTRGTVHDIPLEYDREAGRLRNRLKVRNAGLETAVEAMLEEVDEIDGRKLYVLLMARRLDVALARHTWLAAPHPLFQMSYGYIGGHAMFAEFERTGVILRAMARRVRQDDGTSLDSVTIRPVLKTSQATQETVGLQTAAGRYLDLGAYHSDVTKCFIRRKAHWLSATVPSYTHHAYAIGSRFCDLAASASDVSTHDFIRRSELDKTTQQGTRRQDLVLFYGLGIEEVVILAVRQILDRVTGHGTGTFNHNIAFGLVVRRILSHTAPWIAARLEETSRLDSDEACGKGLANRATTLARQFDDRDYDCPCGALFDYGLWFDRDRDIAFWDRLQKAAKLYTGFGPVFIPAPAPVELEALPGRRGRRATRTDAPPSRWRLIMIEAKKAFDAYQPLYLKSRPTRLTARIMARMNQGYCAFASDPEFRTLFKT